MTMSKGAAVNETVEIAKTVAYALLIALALRVLLFQPYTIPSASMEPNLYEGDYIIVSKFSYGYSKHSIPLSPPLFRGRIFNHAPTRGDIIVFKLPRDGRRLSGWRPGRRQGRVPRSLVRRVRRNRLRPAAGPENRASGMGAGSRQAASSL